MIAWGLLSQLQLTQPMYLLQEVRLNREKSVSTCNFANLLSEFSIIHVQLVYLRDHSRGKGGRLFTDFRHASRICVDKEFDV